jgi:8-oxo-dGTP diphosphatase
MKTSNPVYLVVAAVFRHEGRVLIARRGPGQRHAGKWEFPGGKVEKGETLQQALERELNEEFAIRAVVGPEVARTSHDYPAFSIELVACPVLSYEGDLRLNRHTAIEWVEPPRLLEWDLSAADVAIARYLSRQK